MNDCIRRLRLGQSIALAQIIGSSVLALWPLVAVAYGSPISPATILLPPIAYHLLLGRRKLRALDANAPSHLVHDQLALLGFVLRCCCWKVHLAWPDPERVPSPWRSASDIGISFRDEFRTLRRVLASLIYGGLFAASCTVQILFARFYHSLHADLKSLAQIPSKSNPPTDALSPRS